MLGDHTTDYWILQAADFDLSFGHGMYSVPEKTCLCIGLIYGVLVMIISLATLSSSCQDRTVIWYVIPLGYVQIVVLLILTGMKSLYICDWQPKFYPQFASGGCSPLVFNFVLHGIFGVVVTCGALDWVIQFTDKQRPIHQRLRYL